MYAAVYAEAFRELGCDVWLVAPQQLIDSMPARGAADFTRVAWEASTILSQPLTPKVRAESLWRGLGRLLDDRERVDGRYPDMIVHLFLDAFIHELMNGAVINRSVRCCCAGLWFKPPPRLGWSWRDVAKRLVRFGRRYRSLRSSRWRAILLLDTDGYRHLSKAWNPEILAVPEFSVMTLPSGESPLVTEIQQRAGTRKICSLVGSLEGRKGVRAFLKAAVAAPEDEWFFVMAGATVRETFDAETVELLSHLTAGPQPRVLLEDRWLADETLNEVVAASDLLHVAYERWPYSSNMLCKTAAFQVPAIGCRDGYLGRSISHYGLGYTLKSGEDMPGRFRPGYAEEVAAFARSAGFRDGCCRYLAANNPAALVSALRPLTITTDGSSSPPPPFSAMSSLGLFSPCRSRQRSNLPHR
jgi:hypothetical protein